MTTGEGSDEPVGAVLGLPLSEREMLDILPAAIVVTDPDGRVMLWSVGAERVYGWSEAEVIGKSIVEVLSPSDSIASDREELAAVAAGDRRGGDRTVVHRDGRRLRLRTTTQPVTGQDGAVVAIVGFAQDVTALRAAQQVQRDLIEHLQAALVAGGLGTWRWTAATGRMSWDARLESLFGLAAGEFDGSFDTFVGLIDPTERATVSDAFHGAIESRSAFRVEHQLTWPDGSVHWIAAIGAPTIDADGLVTGALGCSLDVTARNAQNDERERLSNLAVLAAERERVARERLEFLARINDALLASSTIHDLMVNVTNVSVPRLGDWCAIHVFPFAGGPVPEVEVAHSDPAMVGLARRLQERFPYDPDAPAGVGRVIRTGKTEFYPEISAEMVADLDIDGAREVVATLALRSAIIAPLNKRGRKLGALQFVMSTSLRHYTPEDVDLVHTIADRIASSVENLRLYEQQRQIARTLQRSLLPTALPVIPRVEIAARYWPAGEANEVGGDFYDVFALHNADQWAIVIGDVCGTGAGAAALTGLARHTIRTSAWHDDAPPEVLRALDHAVRNSATDAFLTACYATLDTGDGRCTLSVTCGGHPLPVHVDAATGTAHAIARPGTLIGMFDVVRFEPVTTELADGDVVVFYTDGATDVRPPHGLDEAQFAALVQRAVEHAPNAEVIADEIREALETELTFHERDDDIALLILKVTR